MSSDFVTVECVARSPDELGLLASIADRPADDLRRLVYADWLEEQADPRGPLLRDFIEAYRAGRDLPPLDEVPTAWADVTGLTSLSKFAEAELRHRGDELLALARPALRIEAGTANFDDPPPAPAALGTTRLGGDPDLPVGVTYPVAADGVPLHFLGQFNVTDLRGTIAGLAFPEAGLMTLFRPQGQWNSVHPVVADFPEFVRFVWPGTPLVRVPRPVFTDAERGYFPELAPFRKGLRLVETLRLPGQYRSWPSVTLTTDEESQLDEVFPTNLGGEAYILLGHVTHGNTGEEPLKDRPDWVQLILVPHFEGPDFGQSDMSLSYHLPAADLKAGRFDRLEATFG